MYLSIYTAHTHNQAKSIKRSRAIEPSLLQRGRCHICDAFAKVSSVRPWLYTHQLEKMSFKFNTGCTSKNLSQPRHWLLLSLAAIPACRRRPFLSMYLRTSPSADPGRERRASLERCPPDTSVARWQRNNKWRKNMWTHALQLDRQIQVCSPLLTTSFNNSLQLDHNLCLFAVAPLNAPIQNDPENTWFKTNVGHICIPGQKVAHKFKVSKFVSK